MEEQEASRERDSDKIKTLTDHLNKTQTLLYESTKDYLELKYDTRLKERKWMGERDKIMREMDYLKEQIDMNKEEIEMQVQRTKASPLSRDSIFLLLFYGPKSLYKPFVT